MKIFFLIYADHSTLATLFYILISFHLIDVGELTVSVLSNFFMLCFRCPKPPTHWQSFLLLSLSSKTNTYLPLLLGFGSSFLFSGAQVQSSLLCTLLQCQCKHVPLQAPPYFIQLHFCKHTQCQQGVTFCQLSMPLSLADREFPQEPSGLTSLEGESSLPLLPMGKGSFPRYYLL